MATFHELDAVILCGGLGTRLREETEVRPKPMVEIGGRPILWHIMRIYWRYGVRSFVLCLGYKGEVIRDYFLNYRMRRSDLVIELQSNTIEIVSQEAVEDWRVVLVDTGQNAQTGARIRKVLPHVRSSRFFATYGDGVADVDIGKLYAEHCRSGLDGTVTAVRPVARFGEIVSDQGLVRSFKEKPQVTGATVNGGFFVFEKAVFERQSGRENLSLENDVLTELATHGQLASYDHPGFWQCMDTYRDMLVLNELWNSGRPPWIA